MPENYGNPFGEQRSLAGGNAIVSLPEREVIAVSGADRLDWLNSLTTQLLKQLPTGQSVETMLLDLSGRIEYLARVIDDGETCWLLMDPGTASGFAAFLESMRFRMRVAVTNRSTDFVTVGTFGLLPGGIAKPAGIPLIWNDPWGSVQPGGYQYAHGRHPGEGWNYRETLVPREKMGELSVLPAAGTLALEALQIAAARPRVITEVDAKAIPHEFDWLRTAVHLNKGCYRGQETVAKVHNLGHPPRRLVLLHLDGSENVLPKSGDSVWIGRAENVGSECGKVTSAAWHYELGPIALALVKRSTDQDAQLSVYSEGVYVAASQQVVVPVDAGQVANVPRLPRIGGARRVGARV